MPLKVATGAVSQYARIPLVPGEVHYINVRNAANGQGTCGTPRCDVFVTFLNNAP